MKSFLIQLDEANVSFFANNITTVPVYKILEISFLCSLLIRMQIVAYLAQPILSLKQVIYYMDGYVSNVTHPVAVVVSPPEV